MEDRVLSVRLDPATEQALARLTLPGQSEEDAARMAIRVAARVPEIVDLVRAGKDHRGVMLDAAFEEG